MSALDLSEFYDTFFDEAEELLQSMEEILLGLDLDQPDKEALNAIFRAAHSIKGGAATFGVFETLVQTTHKLENVLDAVRNNELPLTPKGLDVFLTAKDVLTDQVAVYRRGEQPDQAAAENLLDALGRLQTANNASETLSVSIHPVDEPAADASAKEAVKNIPSSSLCVTFIGVPEKDVQAIQAELEIVGNVLPLSTTETETSLVLTSELDEETVRSICLFVVNEDQVAITPHVEVSPSGVSTQTGSSLIPENGSPEPAEATADTKPPTQNKPTSPTSTPVKKPTKAASSKEAGTIRVPTQRVDVLVNQVGEVVINQAILNQSVCSLDPIEHASILEGFEQMAGALRSLQESIMALRMVPMDYAFGRYPRVVRETAAKLNKKIELKTIGGATELDKGLIERMIDPLTHLIRNSLDHGIETPEVRERKGKNPIGTITVSAYQEGGRIVISVADDGAGINRDKVIDKAIERGLPANHNMSDNDAFQLIFQPGFSTADVVTDVSGRGVGMDVVRKNIQEVGGQVRIDSQVDKGTTIYISLPLTLAIMDGMSIQVANECFVMPLSHIVECLQPTEDQIHLISQTDYVLSLRGEHLPIIRLSDVFEIENATQDLFKAILVVVQVANDRYALVVDRLLGQHQVVVKSLETHYTRIPGTSGATILGDGSVALILDAAQLHHGGQRNLYASH